ILVLLNIVGIREAARLNIFLAVVDFATQLLLVVIGFVLIFSPHLVFHANLHWGVAPTWGHFFLAIPIAMIAYTGIETVSNLAEEGLRRRPRSDDPLHRHERRRDRSVADHVLDVDLPAAAGDLPAAPSQVQDALAVARRLRRHRRDRRAPAREDQVPRGDVRVRRDAVFHDRARRRGRPPRARSA